MLTHKFAMEFAWEWLESWNSHDLDRILSHYSDDFEMASPYIPALAGEPSGKLRGKKAVGEYWKRALQANPNLYFEMIDVTVGVDSICIYYHSMPRNVKVMECLRFGPEGKVVQAAAHYPG
ncbi:MAG: nuclear transport factor 2 family protein [Acidobacteriales bacterium]|nr:nuclear transport factor 2 family protein [Terriglobales bacterium]